MLTIKKSGERALAFPCQSVNYSDLFSAAKIQKKQILINKKTAVFYFDDGKKYKAMK
jgi:hypothetical protein